MKPQSAPIPPAPDPVRTVEEAEARYRRMCALQAMGGAELRTLLGGDQAKAAPWVETAARFGVAEAQVRYGRMLLDGAGVDPDPKAAFDWFARAARAGEAEAMNMAGRCLENGWGVEVDLALAADWYRRAAEAGYDWGEYNFGNMLFDGRGVAEDRAAAVGWYLKAAGQGHARAMNLLARCCEEGWGTPRDAGAAFDWYRRSAEAGYFRAEFNYASLLTALGLVEEALAWFERACRGATPDSLPGMLALLASQPDIRLTDLARRLGEGP